jgi:hypothetical protein
MRYSGSYDLALSVDVIYHLVEDEVFEDHISLLFQLSRKYVGIYSSDSIQDWPGAHIRHRRFSDWIAASAPQWRLKEKIPNRYPFDPRDPYETSLADFFFYERA